ncbi:MAG: excinuclease ABC subunit UvrC [Anaerolineae bacterium]
MAETSEIQNRIAQFPTKPGVYIMLDALGHVIYVGKAINLRNRVRSYFQSPAGLTPKTNRLVAAIADIDFIITESELEALILEATLIKKHKPHYNVRLKDEKRYPFIRVSWQEDFPRLTIVRRVAEDGARYFGPYTSSWAMRETLDLLRRIFPYRTCGDEIDGRKQRACLYYHIGRCTGPCIGAANKQEYRQSIDRLCLFLEGKSTRIIREMRQRMNDASENLRFEEAATLRDKVNAMEAVVERQRMVSPTLNDHDVIAFARANGSACVQIFFIREGCLIGREYFVLEGTSEEADADILTSFIEQFYSESTHVPEEVIVEHHPQEAEIIEAWLRERRGHKVAIKVPISGEKKKLLGLASENATETLTALRAEWEADEGRAITALEDLRGALDLKEAPARIECYDISNIQGTHSVGSMVVFVKGVARKSDYRRFRIRTVTGADDFASMREVLRRRFAHAGGNKDDSFASIPNLVVIDGGKGQLNAALEAMHETGFDAVPVIGLAKEYEEIYRPGHDEPIRLARSSQGLFLLQRIRDEAHRFAIEYHRSLRGKAATRSALDDVPGIGPKRRQRLLQHFGSVAAIKQASVDELVAVPGVSKTAAESLKRYL